MENRRIVTPTPSFRTSLILGRAGVLFGDKTVLWIPIGAILIVLALWIAVVVRLQTERQEALSAAVEDAVNLATAFSAHIDKTVHDADIAVRWIKHEYERSPPTFQLNEFKQDGMFASDTAVQMAIIGPDGNILQSTIPITHAVSLSDRPHFLLHKSNPDAGLYISAPVIGRVSQRATLQFTRRLDNPDGSFAGVVVLSEDPGFLTSGFHNFEALHDRGMLIVMSDNGYLLSCQVAGRHACPNKNIASAYLQMASPQPAVISDPVDHERRVAIYHHSSIYPVSVLVGSSERDALAGYRRDRSMYLLMATVVSFVLVITAGILTATMKGLVKAKVKMQQLAETDALTGLPNRYLLTTFLRHRIANRPPVGQLALLFVDLDNFKSINDALGHQTGDELIQCFALRLNNVVRNKCFLARVGGDEFVLVVEDADALVSAQNLCQSMIDALEAPFSLSGNTYMVRVSIGLAVYTSETDAASDLLRQADLAMYEAKKNGKATNKSQLRVYSADLSARAMRDIEQQRELRQAIANREFILEYQPIVSLSTGDLRGVEALVRWQHPKKGILPPGEFVPFAESSGYIVPIGGLVLEMACAQFSAWQHEDDYAFYLSVNVSAAQLVTGDLVADVQRCLDRYAVDPIRLKLEITETAILKNSAVVTARLKALRSLGIHVVLDDFGTGYSSLSQLTSLMVDGVKVDKSFTRGVPHDRTAVATFRSIITLTRDLGLSMVVEGVETEQQVQWLRRFADIEVQGFYFGRPVAPLYLQTGRVA